MAFQRLSSSGGQLRVSAAASSRSEPVTSASKVNADFGGVPVSGVFNGGSLHQTMFGGQMGEAEETFIPFYRDMYRHDSVAGAAVDLTASFPFSEYTLTGLERRDTLIYAEAMARLDLKALMPAVTSSFLVDGAFIGSLIYDPRSRVFQDILVHDRMSCTITPKIFHSQEPTIVARSASVLSTFLNSGSPYTRALMATYPDSVVDMFSKGDIVLDPLTTIYFARQPLAHIQPTTSYLKRLLPMYFLEKTLYRGTILEAMKRQRAMNLVTVGTDTWEPTPAELNGILQRMQLAEMDPLGAWVVTRQGVNLQPGPTAGDFWKWTDVIDAMIPHKLRALCVSEAFLAGDASFSTAEVAMSVFTENLAAFRSALTNSVFNQRLFPLIALTRGLYRDPSRVSKERGLAGLVTNLNNTSNLRVPKLHWHKNLDNHDPTVMDMLEKLGDHGIPVPLRMWAAAANVNLEMLLGNLEEDNTIRESIERITGVKPDDAGGMNPNMGGEGNDDFGEMAKLQDSVELRSYKDKLLARRTKPLLARDFTSWLKADPLTARSSRTGNKVHAKFTATGAADRAHTNNLIYRAVKSLADPERRKQVREGIIAQRGCVPSMGL